ncbi:MAG: hypothetical protein ACI4U4_04435 [Bacilli bacterium]
MNKNMNATQVLETINKLWASTADIQKIGCVGYNRALKIKNEIRNQMVDDGWVFPRYLVSMEYVIKYFNIDEKRLKKLADQGGVANAG